MLLRQFPQFVVFQFHKGAIRTRLCRAAKLLMSYFNSIKVRLELLVPLFLLPALFYFNSIKVRLEPEYSSQANAYKVLFQFHKGAIRTSTMARNDVSYVISIP